eukprot:1140195-Pelagomonas_calceolata.AAC.2
MGSGGVKTGRIGAGGYVASAAVYLMQHILQRHRAGYASESALPGVSTGDPLCCPAQPKQCISVIL